MGTTHRLEALPDDASPTAAESLLDLVAEDAEALAALKRASRHVVMPDRDPSALRQMLSRRGLRHGHEEVEGAVFEVSLELLPESWAAARERLRLRVEDAQKTVPIGGASEPARSKKSGPPVLVRRGKADAADPDASPPEGAILRLLSEDTACLREVASLSLHPLLGDELRRVTRRLWRALRGRGRRYEGRYFSDHVAAVVRDLFPHSPGARWLPEWEAAVAKAAVRYVDSQAPHGTRRAPSVEAESAFARVREAALAEDRRAYRFAVRGWVDAELAPFAEDADAG